MVTNCTDPGLIEGFLVPSKFTFMLPGLLLKLTNLVQTVALPDFSIGTSIAEGSGVAPVKLPGMSVEYDNLAVRFIADQNLVGYELILSWMKACSEPEDPRQYTSFVEKWANPNFPAEDALTQPLVLISESGTTRDMVWTFVDAFPVSISGIEFSSILTEAAIVTFDVIFAYTYYTLGIAGVGGGVPGVPPHWIIDGGGGGSSGGGGYVPPCAVLPVPDVAPQAAIIPVAPTMEGNTIILNASPSTGTRPFLYQWSLVNTTSGTVPAIINDQGEIATVFNALDGEYVFEVLISNDAGSSTASVSVTIEQYQIAPDAAAAIIPTGQDIYDNDPFIILSGAGSTGTNLTYSWEKNLTNYPVNNLEIQSPNAEVTQVTGPGGADLEEGTYEFTLTVDNPLGLPSSSNVTVNVLHACVIEFNDDAAHYSATTGTTVTFGPVETTDSADPGAVVPYQIVTIYFGNTTTGDPDPVVYLPITETVEHTDNYVHLEVELEQITASTHQEIHVGLTGETVARYTRCYE